MNLFQIFDQLEKQDADLYDRLESTSRRNALRGFASMGSKMAAAAIPVAMGTLFKKAYGQGTMGVLDVLNFALTLEYLEAEFYDTALKSSGLIPTGAPTGAITTIRDHEVAHVKFLTDAIKAAGGTPVAKPTFDFSYGKGSKMGPFKDAFTSYPLFLAVAQALEDTGVRAYKGQAANLMSNGAVLTAALNIHSVEARHASHIRYMRRNLATGGFPGNKPWITGKDTSGIPGVEAVYAGEEITTQAGVNIIGSFGGVNVDANAANESFDEPLSRDAVLAIAGPFIAA